MPESNPWKTLSSKYVYKNDWISVREDQVVRPDGNPGIYSVVETRIATGVCALTEDCQLYLVGQYRYATKRYSWEIIEGGADPDEEPIVAAKRELQEEAGIVAKSWEALGPEIQLTNCHSSEVGYLFVARDLQETTVAPEATEVLQVKTVAVADAQRMILNGEITDALSIIAIHRLQALGYYCTRNKLR